MTYVPLQAARRPGEFGSRDIGGLLFYFCDIPASTKSRLDVMHLA
jgi:hypothetical protein